jgi:hypothetical protein
VGQANTSTNKQNLENIENYNLMILSELLAEVNLKQSTELQK